MPNKSMQAKALKAQTQSRERGAQEGHKYLLSAVDHRASRLEMIALARACHVEVKHIECVGRKPVTFKLSTGMRDPAGLSYGVGTRGQKACVVWARS